MSGPAGKAAALALALLPLPASAQAPVLTAQGLTEACADRAPHRQGYCHGVAQAANDLAFASGRACVPANAGLDQLIRLYRQGAPAMFDAGDAAPGDPAAQVFMQLLGQVFPCPERPPLTPAR